MFGSKNEEEIRDLKINWLTTPPPPKEIKKFLEMLRQLEFWINHGENELVKKHWKMIAEEAHKNGE